jgi:lactocepin
VVAGRIGILAWVGMKTTTLTPIRDSSAIPSIEPNPEDWPNNDYGNLRLKANSPAINSGDNYWVAGIPTDLDGKPRVVREVVDIGAYEFQAGSPAPKPDPEPQVEHLGGRDRIRTAVAISKEGWEQSDYVVLARNDAYPDALAGVPLAYLYGAPILLTDPDDLPTVTRTEIRRLGAKKVFILGGVAAISQDVRHELSDMGLTVQRIGGRDRYATAALIADQVAPKGAGQVALTNGETFADAISVAAYAAKNGLPILLTTRDALPEETSKALDELNVSSILVIGGEAVIADATVKKIGNYLRLFGDDRYGTAVPG